MRDSTFDRLASELSRDQREDMFHKLSSALSGISEELSETEEGESEGSLDLNEYIRGLGFFSRLWLFLRAIFRGAEQEDILEADMLRQTARDISKRVPDILDPARMQARVGLYNRIRSLEQASRTCFEIVGPASSELRGEFLAFLLEMESEEIKLRIDTDIDPERIVEDKPNISDSDLKRTLESNLDEILGSMPAGLRSRMYVDAQFLDHFRRLGVFEFGSVFSLFHAGRGTEVEPCDLGALREYLVDLASIGRGLRVRPGEVLLRALYIFVRQRSRSEDGGSETDEQQVGYRLDRFAEGFKTVREFFATVPLEGLSKLAAGSIHYGPEYGGGGEDWFQLIKQFWRNRIDDMYQGFAFERHKVRLIQESSELIGVPVYPLESFEGESPGSVSRYALVLGIIDAFMLRVFRERVHPLLRTIQVSGNFYKDTNQRAFNQSFEKLREIPHRLTKFKRDIGPEGNTGRQLVALSEEGYDQKRLIEARRPLITELETRAREITSESIEALRTLVLVLEGILHSSGNEEYDTLSNLPAIEGSNNEVFLRRLSEALEETRSAEHVIANAYDLATVRKL